MSIDEAISDLTTKGHGTAEFIVDADGHVRHDVTVFTLKLDGQQPSAAFFQAAMAVGAIRANDRIQIPANKGQYDIVRIIRPSQSRS